MSLVVLMGIQARLAGAEGIDSRVERGRYLVEHVALCIECHTPRTAEGQILRERLLRGAPVLVQPPPFVKEDWAAEAPNIAGLTGYSDEEAKRLLTQGLTRHGRPPNRPMPSYHMAAGDAEAIVAYLRSLHAP
jgi:mono/diheme cytochrome c family protein